MLFLTVSSQTNMNRHLHTSLRLQEKWVFQQITNKHIFLVSNDYFTEYKNILLLQ